MVVDLSRAVAPALDFEDHGSVHVCVDRGTRTKAGCSPALVQWQGAFGAPTPTRRPVGTCLVQLVVPRAVSRE